MARIESIEKTAIKKTLTKVSAEERFVAYNGYANGIAYKLLSKLDLFKDDSTEVVFERIKDVLKKLANEVNEITIVDRSLLEKSLINNVQVKMQYFLLNNAEINSIVYNMDLVPSKTITVIENVFTAKDLECLDSNRMLYKEAMICGLNSSGIFETVVEEYFN